jgi:hypothetical protein
MCETFFCALQRVGNSGFSFRISLVSCQQEKERCFTTAISDSSMTSGGSEEKLKTEWSLRGHCDMDGARRVSEGLSESNAETLP